jgi:hypothetical protein
MKRKIDLIPLKLVNGRIAYYRAMILDLKTKKNKEKNIIINQKLLNFWIVYKKLNYGRARTNTNRKIYKIYDRKT